MGTYCWCVHHVHALQTSTLCEGSGTFWVPVQKGAWLSFSQPPPCKKQRDEACHRTSDSTHPNLKARAALAHGERQLVPMVLLLASRRSSCLCHSKTLGLCQVLHSSSVQQSTSLALQVQACQQAETAVTHYERFNNFGVHIPPTQIKPNGYPAQSSVLNDIPGAPHHYYLPTAGGGFLPHAVSQDYSTSSVL